MADTETDLLRSSLDLLVLKALSWGPRHGYAISEWIEGATRSLLLLEEGTLYPALHRLERQKLIAAAWRLSDNRQRTRVYTLTRKGRTQLTSQRTRWAQFVEAVGGILNPRKTSET